MGGETAQLSTVNLGTAERRVEREHALDALASKFGLPDRSALIQKIADGSLLVLEPDETPDEEIIEGFRQSWHEAMTGNVRPISELWDELDAD